MNLSKIAMTALFALALGACASKPKNYQELPATTDPNAAIEGLKTDLEAAHADNVPALAPKHFENAKEAYDDAVKARSKNKSNEKVLKDVALGKAHLENAVHTARANSQFLQPVIAARQSALDAKADRLAPKEFKKAEKYMEDLAEDTADSGYDTAQRRSGKAIEKYNEARAEAFSEQYTGRARALAQTARNEGAKKYAPTSLERVEKQIETLDKEVRRQSQISPQIAETAQNLEQNAQKLLDLTRTAKSASGLTDEQIGQRMIENDQRLSALMSQTEQQRLQAQQQQQQLSQTNRGLAADLESSRAAAEAAREAAKPQAVFERVRERFSPEEAEVVLNNEDKIVVRMKSLNFASGSANIPAQQTTLLDKLSETLKDVNASKVTVEGHTDAVGAPAKNLKLSEKRAESVGNYLSRKTALGENIATEGFGDTKPLTTNKTKAGRAENRRVDVVIEL